MEYVFALDDAIVGDPDGFSYMIRKGEPWAKDDPVAQHNPGMFGATPPPPYPRRSVLPVEATTAAPGEKRVTRRG